MLASTPAQDFVLDDMTVDAQIDLRKFVLTRNSPLYMAIELSVAAPNEDTKLFPDWEYSTDGGPAASAPISPASSKPARPALVVMSTPSRPRMERTASISDIPSLSQNEPPTGGQDTTPARAFIDSDASSSSSSRSRRSSSLSLALKELFNPEITLTPEQAITIAPLPLMREKPHKASRQVPAAFAGLAPGEKRTRFLCPVPPPRYNSGDFVGLVPSALRDSCISRTFKSMEMDLGFEQASGYGAVEFEIDIAAAAFNRLSTTTWESFSMGHGKPFAFSTAAFAYAARFPSLLCMGVEMN
ncbi:hypothetical protein DFH06DRAFT_1149681 [Mycena polygramma]|nr:hypothetical protein DFH06DRAFT_1149681 [Mycena polygramma]